MEPLHHGISVSVANDPLNKDASTQTNNRLVEEELAAAKKRIDELELEVKAYKQKFEEQKFRILNMVEDDEKVKFYNGFQLFGALQAFYRYLGPAVDHLFYSAKQAENAEPVNRRCHQRFLPLLEELFMLLVHL